MTNIIYVDHALDSLEPGLRMDSRDTRKMYDLVDVNIPDKEVRVWKAHVFNGVISYSSTGESHEGPLRHYLESRLEDSDCAGIIPLSKVVRAVLNELDMQPVLTGTLPGYQVWRRRDIV